MATTENGNDNNEPKSAGAQAGEAVVRNENIRREVRDVVVKALSQNRLERDEIRQVIKDTIEGALEQAPEPTKTMAASMQKVADGVEDALATFAEASRLTAEETKGRIDAFTEHDLKRALDDLDGLEDLFSETLKGLAKTGHETTQTMFKDLASHTSRTGSDVSASMNDAREALHNALASARPPRVSDGLRTAQAGVSGFAAVMSGILAGMAEGLAPKPVTPDSDVTPEQTAGADQGKKEG